MEKKKLSLKPSYQPQTSQPPQPPNPYPLPPQPQPPQAQPRPQSAVQPLTYSQPQATGHPQLHARPAHVEPQTYAEPQTSLTASGSSRSSSVGSQVAQFANTREPAPNLLVTIALFVTIGGALFVAIVTSSALLKLNGVMEAEWNVRNAYIAGNLQPERVKIVSIEPFTVGRRELVIGYEFESVFDGTITGRLLTTYIDRFTEELIGEEVSLDYVEPVDQLQIHGAPMFKPPKGLMYGVVGASLSVGLLALFVVVWRYRKYRSVASQDTA